MKYKTLFVFFVILFLAFLYLTLAIQGIKNLHLKAWSMLVKFITAILFIGLCGCAAPSEYWKHAYLDAEHGQLMVKVALDADMNPRKKRDDDTFLRKDEPCKYWESGCPEGDDGGYPRKSP